MKSLKIGLQTKDFDRHSRIFFTALNLLIHAIIFSENPLHISPYFGVLIT